MDGYNAPHSPHARVRVINISEYDAKMKTKEQLLMSPCGEGEGCATPKKKPAKIISVFKKDPTKKEQDKKVASATNTNNTNNATPSSNSIVKATKVAAKVAEVTKDVLPIPMPNTNDEALSDFLNRVNSSHSKDAAAKKQSHAAYLHQQHQQQNNNNNLVASPQRRNSAPSVAMLPDYARYQEARIQRTLSRGNSYSNLSPGGSGAATSPGVEWVDYRTNPPTLEQHGWDSNTLVQRHSFPSNNNYCARGGDGPPSPAQAAAMAAMHQEYGGGGYPHYPPPLPPHHYPHHYPHHHHSAPPSPVAYHQPDYYHGIHRRPSFSHDQGSPIPSAAAISRGSSSSFSEDEEQRQYMDYMAHHGAGGPPYAAAASAAHAHHHPHHHPHHQLLQHQQQYPAAATAAAASMAPADDCHQESLPLVEISPGVHEPLRRADETVHAVRHDFYVPVCCFGCSEDIFAIADAKYVICPTCRVVSPIEEGALDGQVLRQHGLGLGFTCESLFQIQSDILLEQR